MIYHFVEKNQFLHFSDRCLKNSSQFHYIKRQTYKFSCSSGCSGCLYLDLFEIIFFILLTVVPDCITIFQNGSNKRDVYCI